MGVGADLFLKCGLQAAKTPDGLLFQTVPLEASKLALPSFPAPWRSRYDRGLYWKGGLKTKDAFPENEGVSVEELTLIPLPDKVKQLAATEHACVLLESSELYCWGYNANGQLGLGLDVTVAEPTLVPAPVALSEVVVGHLHTCGSDAQGIVRGAGQNPDGCSFRRLPIPFSSSPSSTEFRRFVISRRWPRDLRHNGHHRSSNHLHPAQ